MVQVTIQVDADKVKDCPICSWHHDNVEFKVDPEGKTYYICPLVKSRVYPN